MSIRHFTYAVELDDAGSFRRAAENLNITHAALVHSIRALEEQYGARLFDRGRGVKAIPTETGKVFLQHARKMLLNQSDLEHDIRLLQDPGLGVLNLSFAPFPNHISCQEAVGRMISRYPALQIRASLRQYTQITDIILKREADIAVAEMGQLSNHPELGRESLGQHRAGFFCRPGHPLLKKKPLTIGDIVQFPWCCTRIPSRVKNFLPSELARAGHFDPVTMELVPAIEIETVCNVKTLVAHSDVLFAAPLVMLKAELRKGGLAVLPFHEAWLVTNYGFIWLKNRSRPPAVERFMDEVRAIEEELFEEEKGLVETFLAQARSS